MEEEQAGFLTELTKARRSGVGLTNGSPKST